MEESVFNRLEDTHPELAQFFMDIAEGKRPYGVAQVRGFQITRPIVKSVKLPGRNDPCPCGSGKKWKKCCSGNH